MGDIRLCSEGEECTLTNRITFHNLKPPQLLTTTSQSRTTISHHNHKLNNYVSTRSPKLCNNGPTAKGYVARSTSQGQVAKRRSTSDLETASQTFQLWRVVAQTSTASSRTNRLAVLGSSTHGNLVFNFGGQKALQADRLLNF
jgi:hypothetical protein